MPRRVTTRLRLGNRPLIGGKGERGGAEGGAGSWVGGRRGWGGGPQGALVWGSARLYCALYGTRTSLGLNTSKSLVLLDIHVVRVQFL